MDPRRRRVSGLRLRRHLQRAVEGRFTHPALYAAGMVLLATGTALSLIQAMASFCVVDGLLGRTFIPGSRRKAPVEAPESRAKDRRRALALIGGAFILGLLFSAVLLISEINAVR